MYISLLLLALVFIIFLIDFVPQFTIWQSRIYIGRILDNGLWIEKVKNKCVSWLDKTPTIKLTGQTRLVFIDILRGNYKRTAIQDWQQAALVLGIYQYFKVTNDANAKAKITTFLATKINSNGSWKKNPTEIDGVILAYAFLNCDFIDHNYNKPSYDFMYSLILNLKGSDGTIAYRSHSKNYRFVDTIGFICPFLIAYGTKFNNQEAVNLGIVQIAEFNKYALYTNSNLPCHTYLETTKKPVGLFGWGRGLGWYAIGLIDAWNGLPNSHLQKENLTLNVIQFTKTILDHQNSDGSWSWLVTQPDARNDSSTTATLAWFLANAATIATIENQCTTAKDKAMQYLKTVTQRNGAIDFSQGDTKGIAIHSLEFTILPFTQGFCLRTFYAN